MKLNRLLLILTAVNFVMLAWTVAGPRVASADNAPGVLRGTALQIVDTEGRVRASLGLLYLTDSEPNGTGEETVLLRLINAAGQPSVKIGVSGDSAGMSLVGGDDASYVLVSAEGPASSLKLVGPEGRTNTITP